MFDNISYQEVPERAEVWVVVGDAEPGSFTWADARPHVAPEYRRLPAVSVFYNDSDEGSDEVWVLSTAPGTRKPVRCKTCERRAMLDTTGWDAPRTGLVVEDPDGAGIYGYARCPACDERTFIQTLALELGVDLGLEIDRSGPLPALVEVFR